MALYNPEKTFEGVISQLRNALHTREQHSQNLASFSQAQITKIVVALIKIISKGTLLVGIDFWKIMKKRVITENLVTEEVFKQGAKSVDSVTQDIRTITA